MSSIPGYVLEDYVAWLHDFIINERGDTNDSLAMAEALGTIPKRPRFDLKDTNDILGLYEPYRDKTETYLGWYNEDVSGSWRDYAGCNFDFIPDAVHEAAVKLIKQKVGDNQ